ncbi:MAG: lactonase family protein [Spirochaetaceae bacterium]|nr:lactonase family protein [Spirochaetaceae bacterium]
MRVYIGTYTRDDTGSEGIYRGELDVGTGELTVQGVAARVDNPSFLALSAAGDFLYAVNEVSDLGTGKHGAASAFRVASDGALTAAGQQLAGASGPCHVCAHPSGELVFAANYGGGALSMFRCAGGDLVERLVTIDHEGSSVNPERQQEPHPHSVNLSPDGAWLYVPDLGIDRIVIYRIDVAAATLTRAGETATAPGAGPRHFTFHPRGRVAYGINELDSTVTAYAYGATDGSLTEMQTVSTLPDGWSGVSTCADIHVHPNGRFVYGSNRGHDSIAIFAIGGDGRLEPVGHESTQGRTPRNFALDPSGALLLAANQDSGTIVTFHVDAATGLLRPTGHVAAVPSPVCVVPVPGT